MTCTFCHKQLVDHKSRTTFTNKLNKVNFSRNVFLLFYVYSKDYDCNLFFKHNYGVINNYKQNSKLDDPPKQLIATFRQRVVNNRNRTPSSMATSNKQFYKTLISA